MSYLDNNEEADYYSDGLVTKQSDPEFSSMLKSLGIGARAQSLPLPSNTYASDPTVYNGKLARFARYFVENIEIAQYSDMVSPVDLYEDGQLLAFTITCNDSSMIPACYVENAVRARDTINDLSFLESVIHGRGMTHAEATSTIKVEGTDVSRDVSGQQLSLFPYITRYKDTITGDSSDYSVYKGTVDDKCYVMNFEPTAPIPYKRLYFNVANNSKDGTRLINRLEIKRMVFIDADNNNLTKDISTEFTQFNEALGIIKDKVNAGALKEQQPLPQPPAQSFNTSTIPNFYEDYIRYAYSRLHDTTRVKRAKSKKIKVDDVHEQKERAILARRINGLSTAVAAVDDVKNDDTTMRVKFG